MFNQFDAESTLINQSDIVGDGFVQGTGGISLVDGIGLEWFVNTDVSFATTSSASAAVSEASFTQAVNATTVGGGSVAATLNDAFDGYNSLLVNGVPNTTANYNQLGAPPTTEDGGRELVFPVATFGDIQVSRKLFVPTNDSFARWLNIVTNTGATTQTVTLDIQNNLGSDANTQIVTSSDGDATAELTDSWVTTFQNFSGSTSSDVRLGHILQGADADTPLARISFVNGDDNPTWGYDLTLAPGETQIIMNFATGQATRDAAATKAAELAGLSTNALQGLSTDELSQIVNFSLSPSNQAPTVALDKEVTSLPENTATPVKVADIVVTDDGVGTNNLSLSGADAAIFEIQGTELFIKAGTTLDFETQSSFDVTVEVDDPALGSTFEDSVNFNLTLTDIMEMNVITGTSGNDSLRGTTNAEQIEGLGCNDSIVALGGDDILLGGDGDDRLNGGSGNDFIDGGAGKDTLISSGNGNFVATQTTLTGPEGIDTFTGIEVIQLTGGLGNNTLDASALTTIQARFKGGAGNDTLLGGQGKDNLQGQAGNDLLKGGLGKDTLTGGNDSDTFDYRNLGDSLLSGFDVITDFNAAEDKLWVSQLPTLFTANAGTVNQLNSAQIGALLTPAILANSGDSAVFNFRNRVFVAINNGTAGYQAGGDAIIELAISGLSGSLSAANFTLG